MKARLTLVLLGSLALAACQGDAIAPPTARSMDNPAQATLLSLVNQPSLNRSQGEALTAIRGRSSAAEVHLARVANSPASVLKQGSAVRIEVAPGLEVEAVGQSLQQRGAEDLSWGGNLRGTHGWVQVVVGEEGVTGTVTVGETKYSIEPLGNGLHAVARIDQSGFPPEHAPDNPNGTPSDVSDLGFAAAKGGNNEGTVGTMALSTINVLVVYTASAASASGNIANRIQLAVDETNQSYTNSGISINMVRVHTAQVTYNEAGRSFSQHVSALRSSTDGLMDNVHTLRNTYAADVVVLVVNDSEACGVASTIKATATSAFAVAHWSCITGYYSFAHEVGHLQGARHDRFVDSSTSPYAYGHGFIPSSKRWRTVMAYGNNCSNCTRIQWWSNPLKTYPSTGEVMGTAAYEDNARVLNLTAPTVALFR
ncbi:MAG TPA: M12 family metallo-peptidase [Longimicrobium sp.]|nr:M12 family metallo-peptidase [Longimicrobium sp.]